MRKIAELMIIGIILLGLCSCNQIQSTEKCEYKGEFFGNPNPIEKTCTYNCKGYGTLATFTWPKNQPCPPSFNGKFTG